MSVVSGGTGRHMLTLSSSQIDLGCVKTHTSAKCGKYNSPSNRRAVCVQYDLALIICNAFEIFYARSERGRFYTAKTRSGHRAANFAVTHNAALGRLWPDGRFA